ncbi:MAG: murein transglycosylase, partial [Enterobacteriaceae bacterium]
MIKKIRGYRLAMLCGLLTVSVVAQADSLQQQRQRYQQIKTAWDNKQMATVESLLPGLSQYPLYPYLQYRKLTDELPQLSLATVQGFI